MSGAKKDWLSDGVGEPDSFERGVEESLRAARHEPDVEGLVGRLEGDDSPTAAGVVGRIGWRRPALLAAAGLVLVAAAWGVLLRGGGSAWERASGAAWRVGAWVETGSGSEEFSAASVGRVTVGPGSRVRLLAAEEDEHRLELAEGSLEALIYAPPRLFFVETPGVTAVDMGCAYELDVAADGSGRLRVTAGWVDLEAKDGSGVVSRVPAGAVCLIDGDGTPGLPVFEDAGAGFVAAVGALGAEDGALGRVLEAARARDSLTLWHLIARTSEQDRSAVVDRLQALVPTEGVREGALVVDAEALDAWWSAVRRSW